MKQTAASVLQDHVLTATPPTRVESNGPSVVTGTIRVVVVSRQRFIREAFAAVLSGENGIEIVGSTALERRAIELVHEARPNVVLLDLTRPGLEEPDLVRTIERLSCEARLLMLTDTQDEAMIYKALTAGARGYVSEEAGMSELRKAIRGVSSGGVWVEHSILLRWLRSPVSAAVVGDDVPVRMNGSLTAREQEILRLLALGGTNKAIAKALFISDKTVKAHLNRIFRKLQVTGRLQAVLYAVRQGLSDSHERIPNFLRQSPRGADGA